MRKNVGQISFITFFLEMQEGKAPGKKLWKIAHPQAKRQQHTASLLSQKKPFI